MNAYDLYKPALCWTSEPPTVPGWYWWTPSESGAVPQVVCISVHHLPSPPKGTVGVWPVSAPLGPRLADWGGEWAGPLVSPGETP